MFSAGVSKGMEAWECGMGDCSLLETNVNKDLRNYCGFGRRNDNNMVKL